MESTFREHGERRRVLESTKDLLIYAIFSMENTGEYKRLIDIYHFFHGEYVRRARRAQESTGEYKRVF